MTLSISRRLIAIVGRPNVGKSTLFNKIVHRRKNLVHNEPGVTRDRIFSRATHEKMDFYVCDTGGFEPSAKDNIKAQLVEQAEMAIEEADAIIFVVDGKEGLHPCDRDLLNRIRKANKHFAVAVNKCDVPFHDSFAEDFRKLGVSHVFPVSAEHSRGIGELLDHATIPLANLPPLPDVDDEIKFAIIGRPNVGKSSILNRIAGTDRSIVDPRPGTTRDSVDISIKYHGKDITIVDTAGIRRKGKMADKLEKFSAFRSVTALEECHVSALVIDAIEGATEGDARVAGYAFEMRKPIIIVVNKWDLIADKDSKTAQKYTENLRIALRYIPYAPIIYVSALENLRVSKLLPLCMELFEEGSKRVATSAVNKALKLVLEKHTPPLTKNRTRRIKFYYATQAGTLPPRFIIFCSEPDEIHFSYKRYVENAFKEAFGFANIPIAIHFKERHRKSLAELLNKSKIPTSKLVDDSILSEEEMGTLADAANIAFDDDNED